MKFSPWNNRSFLAAFALLAMTLGSAGARASDEGGQDSSAETTETTPTPGFVRPVDPDIVRPEANTGAYLGATVGFGQGRTTDGGSPGMAFRMGFEPGYQMQMGHWSRLEMGAEVFFGRVAFRSGSGDDSFKANMPIGLGLMPKIGYGYSLGSKLYGVWRLGVGPVMAKFSGERNDGAELEAADTLWGLAGQLSVHLVLPATESLNFIAGAELNHYQFDLGKLDVTADDGTRSRMNGRSLNVNAPSAVLGMRFVL